MKRQAWFATWLLAAACATPSAASRREGARMTEAPSPVKPQATPVARSGPLRLVSYPGLEVSYVLGLDRECYHLRETYYTFQGGNWFYACTPGDAWSYIEMKYVPPDLFRVLGNLPPQLEGRARPPAPPPASFEEH
ncbi:MAG: hypothetical protein ACT4PV_13160 [Planctomycetaceae bacterium]